VLDAESEDAFFDFAPAERPWRDVLCARRRQRGGGLPHRLANVQARSRLLAGPVYGLHRDARRREICHREQGPRRLTASRVVARVCGHLLTRESQKPIPGQLSKQELKALVRSVPMAKRTTAREAAPDPAKALEVVVKLNAQKRDLRSIEEVQGEIRGKAAKRSREVEGGQPPPAAAGGPGGAAGQ